MANPKEVGPVNIINLDDSKIYQRYDPQGMIGHINNMPDFCEKAWQSAMAFELPEDYTGINKVVILGMGGSAIGGDLLSSYVMNEAKVPIFLQRDFTLPAFVDDNTLVIASSCSGATEETLFAFEESFKTGAKKLAINTGGTLKPLALEKNIPVFSYDYMAPPRAVLPFSLLPILSVLQKLDIIGDKSRDVAEMVGTLRELLKSINTKVPLKDNQAKQLASSLYGHLPLIYGAEILSQVAHRWKTQFNENSKAWAFYEVFPELNHNAVSGYDFPKDLAGKIMIVLLRAPSLSQRIQMRYRLTCKLLDEARIKYYFVDGTGKSPLSHVMSTVMIGDYTSCYLAVLYGTDPSFIKNIDFLKQHWKVPVSEL
jgi:glucose/mannose-6-phosphate isomerase